MNIRMMVAMASVVCVMSLAAVAETTVTLSDVHMCCGSCVNGVKTALKAMPDVNGVGSTEKKTIVLTAPDAASAQKAVNALVAAGYFGKSSDAAIKVEAPSGAPDGKVQTLTVSGVHVCCGSCVTAINGVLSKVDGVTGNTVKRGETSFNVTGNFAPKTIFERLNAAGLAGKVGTAPANATPAQ